MAGSSGGGSFSGPNPTRKHGLSRFSLARLFNLSSYTHRTAAQRCSNAFDSDRRSESSSIGFSTSVPPKAQPNTKDSTRFPVPGPSSSSSESNSFRNVAVDGKDSQDLKKEFLECPLCLFELPRLCFPELRSCTHRACYNCLQQYLKIEITESRVNVSCPECTEPIHPSDICMILNDEILLGKYESFMLRRVLITEPDARWCPAPDCGYAVIARGCAGCPKLKCERPGCNTFFCYHCKQEWHPNQTCDAARAQRAHHYTNPRSASVSFSQDSIVQTGDDIKPCPCCKVLIIKMDDGSCNHMTCSVCGTEFCWLCMKEISDLHYLSPSGCTFWGKKPWSRKKKIMWQLGMLVGAPVGIALIAGIAVPAIIIGVPVWVGRKLHAKYSRPSTSRHARNLIVTSGVLASILVSPILAGIAVGIGVPILLAYVYGVVPISLCRSGGCGVSTSASGVRIEFDEENELGMGNTQSAGNYDGASVDTTASQRGVNPSIGEVSLGMSASLSLGSGSHLDRMTLNRDRESDRESASNVALAGSIASASLLAGASKLEVQADVSSNKRFSLSSHSETASATVSLSERSAIMSLADDASTKALAGSILGYKDSSAVTPVEVHVDAHNLEEMRMMDSFAKEQIEANSILAEYYQQSSIPSEKLENTLPLHSASGDCVQHAPIRLKLSKSCKKRNRNNAVLEDVESDFRRSSDSVSVQSETYVLPGHVHFNELKECCVSFIDESPSADSLIKPMDSNSDTKVFIFGDQAEVLVTSDKREFKKVSNTHGSCSFGKQHLFIDECSIPRRSSELKCVTRSISFCNSCTSTHRSCCPSMFQGEADDKNTNLRHKFNNKLPLGDSFSKYNALSNRAYRIPCSMQDVSVGVTAKENMICNPSTIVPVALTVPGPYPQCDQLERSTDCCHLGSHSYTKLYRSEKDRTHLCPETANFESIIVDTDFYP